MGIWQINPNKTIGKISILKQNINNTSVPMIMVKKIGFVIPRMEYYALLHTCIHNKKIVENKYLLVSILICL